MKLPREVPEVVRAKYDDIIRPIREEARAVGYAIAVHGSLARDIDLVAIPWTADAADERTLIEAVCRGAKRAGDEWGMVGHDVGTAKPHGRQAWTIHLEGRTWIDLSIMPRGATP